MIKRIIEDELLELMEFFPAIGIVGPRQSGKTTLAKHIMSKISKETIYIDLESPTDRNRFGKILLYIFGNSLSKFSNLLK